MDLDYRYRIYYISAIVFIIGVILGTAQMIKKIKKKPIKIMCAILFAASLITIAPFAYLGFGFAIRVEHVVVKEDYKLVAQVDGFNHTFVYYYDYINPFIQGKRMRLEEYYGTGGFDPIKNQYGFTYNVERYTWYDDNGNRIEE
ncbi:MAG: hypothetical protein FWG36_04610 [Oscillospiraceae bacterium]|nr:hypothetical protein [Oscillospiraceae bacterium]